MQFDGFEAEMEKHMERIKDITETKQDDGDDLITKTAMESYA